MKPLRLLALLCATLPVSAAPAWCAAPVQSPAEALPEGRAVIDRFVEVTRARGVLEKTSSMHVVGEFSMPAMGVKGSMEAWSAKPNKRSMSVEMGAFGKMVTGFNGQVGWMTHPMIGARLLKDTELLQTRLEADYDSVLKESDTIESIKTVGRENFEGKDCYKVEVVAKPLEGMDAEKTREVRTLFEFYDVASGLLVGTKGRQEGELGGGPYTQVVADYKDFGGQLMATKTTVRQTGQEVVVTILEVEFDTATESAFTPPADVQGLLQSQVPKASQPK